ncbi:MAG: hypothetical protein VX642_13655 [Bdellovibrionota bacterium]|nr:hypothetical protein [Bdellovibrionota bacterium]
MVLSSDLVLATSIHDFSLEEKQYAKAHFQELKSYIERALALEPEAFSEFYTEDFKALLEEPILYKVAYDLKVKIHGKTYDKAFVNYSNKKPKEIYIDMQDMESFYKNPERACTVLHELLSLNADENYQYEISRTKVCKKLNYLIVNRVLKEFHTEQNAINQLVQFAITTDFKSIYARNPQLYYHYYIGSPEKPQFMASAKSPQLAEGMSVAQCYRAMCKEWEQSKCEGEIEGFQESKMFCPGIQGYLKGMTLECKSLGFKNCEFEKARCGDSPHLNTYVHMACIGPRISGKIPYTSD